MIKISPRWPFDPSKTPFFYGWVIWAFSTLGFLFSIPGQTMGMAVFTDPLIDALGLTRTELSLAYLCGTVGSALLLTRAGRLYDLYGGRIMITLASMGLGLMVFFISMTDRLVGWFGGGAFMLIMLGYFGVRFAGQGVLTSCSRNVLLNWFVKRRGMVSGVRGVFVSVFFSLAPLGLAWLILTFDWRGALWVMAAIVGLVFPLAALIFIRDTPESVGLLPDGEKKIEGRHYVSALHGASRSLDQARRDPVFWIYSCSLAVHAMFGTALTFHVVSIFAEAGRSREEAFSYFIPSAIFSTVTNLLASWMVDKQKLKPFLILMLVFFIIGAFGLLNLSEPWGFWLLAAGFGSGGGLWGVISNLAYIRFFGPLNLGAISGFSTSITVFASAIGPAAFSLGLDYFGDYGTSVKVCIVLLMLLLTAAILVKQQALQEEGVVV